MASSSRPPKKPRVLIELDVSQKRALCVHAQANPRMSQAALALWAKDTFKLLKEPNRGTVSRILEDKATFLAVRADEMTTRKAAAKRTVNLVSLQLDDMLFDVISQWLGRCGVTDALITEKARRLGFLAVAFSRGFFA